MMKEESKEYFSVYIQGKNLSYQQPPLRQSRECLECGLWRLWASSAAPGTHTRLQPPNQQLKQGRLDLALLCLYSTSFHLIFFFDIYFVLSFLLLFSVISSSQFRSMLFLPSFQEVDKSCNQFYFLYP